jgi:CubicO group peptidase (beta-lactamase class C family)
MAALNGQKKMVRCVFTKITAALTLLLCATVCVKADEVDSYVEMQMRSFHIPGISLAVVHNGQIVKAQGYGLAHIELNVPMTKEMVLEIGSMTKQFTATAIMMLVEEGKVGLDDKLSKYFPNVPAAWSAITVRHLLTHTSGITENAEKADHCLPADVREDSVLIDNSCYTVPLGFRPGEAWAYSNAGYHLLAAIIKKASGMSCADFTTERILKPLGMLNGHVSVLHGIVANRAAGYEWKNNVLENRAAMPLVGSVGGVGILSTVGDLAKWDASLYTDRLLKRSSLEQMWTPVKLEGGATPAFNYGFGWFLDTYRGHRVISHGGVTPGFSSSITRFVDDKLTVILLTNSSGQIVDQFAREIAALYLPSLAIPKKGSSDPDAKTSQMLEKALAGMMSGKLDLTLFTPAMQHFLTTDSGKEFSQWAASFGALKSFTFADREEVGRERILHYRIILGDNAFTFCFRMTEDRKIAHAFFW